MCRELTKFPGLEQVLVTRRGSELARRVRADGLTVLEVPWTLSLDPRAWAQLCARMVSFRPHILHAHDSHALWHALAARRWLAVLASAFLPPAARAFGDTLARVIGTRRVDFHVRRWSPWRRADRIIAVSDAVRAVLAGDGIPAAEIPVVPDGIDGDEVRRAAQVPLGIRRRLGLPPAAPLAVNVAALVDHKDHRTLIRAAQHARVLRPDLHWTIAGDGELRGSLAAEIARLELRDRVHLLGYVREADALIREADVFVMSSKKEGLGSAILNALALEKPVVATRAGGIPEILPPESLVPVSDAQALARKVVQALDHPRPFPLPPQFTAPAMARGVLAVYRSLI